MRTKQFGTTREAFAGSSHVYLPFALHLFTLILQTFHIFIVKMVCTGFEGEGTQA